MIYVHSYSNKVISCTWDMIHSKIHSIMLFPLQYRLTMQYLGLKHQPLPSFFNIFLTFLIGQKSGNEKYNWNKWVNCVIELQYHGYNRGAHP